MMNYSALIKQSYQYPVRQVILYVGEGRMRMPDRIEKNGSRPAYEFIDIRDFDAGAMMETGNHGDLALAVLCGRQGKTAQHLEKGGPVEGAGSGPGFGADFAARRPPGSGGQGRIGVEANGRGH